MCAFIFISKHLFATDLFVNSGFKTFNKCKALSTSSLLTQFTPGFAVGSELMHNGLLIKSTNNIQLIFSNMYTNFLISNKYFDQKI